MKYKVLYSDPPWTFATYSDKGKGKSPEQHYSCMTMDDIRNLPVKDMAADDAVLFMWCTDPLLDQQIEIGKAWGFQYKTVGFYWTKTTKHGKKHIGCGYYTRANPEPCLLFTRGKPGRPALRNVNKWVTAPVREHSRKPDEIRDLIRDMYEGPRLEMFARTTVDGWSVYGNEVDKF